MTDGGVKRGSPLPVRKSPREGGHVAYNNGIPDLESG
jgi:hypothetical protein